MVTPRKVKEEHRCPSCDVACAVRNPRGLCQKCKRARTCKACLDWCPPEWQYCYHCRGALRFVEAHRPRWPPVDGWPEGHLERLAERASRGLPLFGRGEGTDAVS